jgi:hypothetical protein
VVLPTNNKGRLNTLATKLKAQDIEIYQNDKPINSSNVLRQNGDIEKDFVIPTGSMIIPNRQPEAPLISAILEFDADINESVLLKERQKKT